MATRSHHGRPPSVRSALGQALMETLVMMSFLLLFVFGCVHLSLLAATKYMVNYAAFTAARTVLVYGWQPPRLDLGPIGEIGVVIGDFAKIQLGYPAAWQVLDNIRWWQEDDKNGPDFPLGLSGMCPDGSVAAPCALSYLKALTVTYRVPLGFPIVPVGEDGVAITAAAPFIIQHASGDAQSDIPEEGDNAGR